MVDKGGLMHSLTFGIYFGAELPQLHFQFIDFVLNDKKVLQTTETALEYIPCYRLAFSLFNNYIIS